MPEAMGILTLQRILLKRYFLYVLLKALIVFTDLILLGTLWFHSLYAV